MGAVIKPRYQKLLLCMGRGFMKVMVGGGDRDAVTDLRRRSSVCVYGRTYGQDGGTGEVDLSMVLHDLLSQYHGALDHG